MATNSAPTADGGLSQQANWDNDNGKVGCDARLVGDFAGHFTRIHRITVYVHKPAIIPLHVLLTVLELEGFSSVSVSFAALPTPEVVCLYLSLSEAGCEM